MIKHLVRIAFAYGAAFLLAATLLNFFVQVTWDITEYYFPVANYGFTWTERLQWFAGHSLIVLVLTLIPSIVLIVISEHRGTAPRNYCAWSGFMMGFWPLILTGGLLPMYIAAPGIGYLSGLVYWKIAGRHAGSGGVVGAEQRMTADAHR